MSAKFEKAVFSIDAGRQIMRDGHLFVSVRRESDKVAPLDVGLTARLLASALNTLETRVERVIAGAEITLEVEQDDQPVAGNFATGDDDRDREIEQEINSRLDGGDVWAWAEVSVVASAGGVTGEPARLCGCSYRDEAEFRSAGGYFDDMRSEAISLLADKLRTIFAEIA